MSMVKGQLLKRQREERCLLVFFLQLFVAGLLPVNTNAFSNLLGDNKPLIKDQCAQCFCYSKYKCKRVSCCYEFDASYLTDLDFRVNCSQPRDSVIISGPKYGKKTQPCSGFKLTNSLDQNCMTALPRNLCDFPDIRAIIVHGTELSEFPDVSCLGKLVLLDLRRNKLTSIPENAFAGLATVEEIRLDENLIEFIHVNAFDVSLPKLNRFTVTSNRLLTVEPWPMLMHHKFCVFDFSYNRIQRISYTMKTTFDTSKDYGPGFVDLSYNNMSESPIRFAKKVGIFKQVKMWSKFFSWGIDVRHNPFYCDCDFYEIAKGLKFITTVQKLEYFDVICDGPPQFKGMRVVDLPVDELTCSFTENCPQNCACYRRPGKEDVLVDCSGSGLSQLPPLMPPGSLTLDLSNNSMTFLASKEYLARTLRLNVSGNMVDSIEEDVPRLLHEAEVQSLDLRNNPIHALPYTFQALSSVVLYLDPETLSCTCELKWFPGWAQQSARPRYQDLFCKNEDGRLILLRNATNSDLGCQLEEVDTAVYKIALGSAAGVVVVMVVVLVIFRHELRVLSHVVTGLFKRRKLLSSKTLTSNTGSPPIYDVFLSTSQESEVDVTWVNDVLLPLLREYSLRVYWPVRDCEPGSVELEQVTKKLQDSASALVVLSEDYVSSPASLFQFRQAYNRMLKQGQGRLYLLHRGSFSRRKITEPSLRAMVTLRMTHKNCSTDGLQEIIGNLSDELTSYRFSGVYTLTAQNNSRIS